MRYPAIHFACLVATACAAQQARLDEGRPPLATTHYYEGTSTGVLPSGQTFPNGIILARRTLAPEDSSIVEQVISADGRRPASEYEVRMKVVGSAFTMKEAAGGFEGNGSLDGSPWRWTAWRSISRLPDGTRVESTDSLVADGLRARKTIFNPAGAVIIRTIEQLNAVSAERFAERRGMLLSGR